MSDCLTVLNKPTGEETVGSIATWRKWLVGIEVFKSQAQQSQVRVDIDDFSERLQCFLL